MRRSGAVKACLWCCFGLVLLASDGPGVVLARHVPNQVVAPPEVVKSVTYAPSLTACLGVEIATLPQNPDCVMLYEAVTTGVHQLNKQLKANATEKNHEVANLHPVSIISASESQQKHYDGVDTLYAMLVQVAPFDKCDHKGRCDFDMAQVQVYSLLLNLDQEQKWALEGSTLHEISDGERAQIEQQYLDGEFYGSDVALGVYSPSSSPLLDAPEGGLLSQQTAATNAKELLHSPITVFAIVASCVFGIGLVFHQRRLQNGYAPITLSKRMPPGASPSVSTGTASGASSLKGQVQAKNYQQHASQASDQSESLKPIEVPPHPLSTSKSLKRDDIRRFAV